MIRNRIKIPVDEKQQVEDRSPPMKPSSHQPGESVRIDEKEKMKQQWLEDNREAIAKYNERIEKEGTFGEEYGISHDAVQHSPLTG